jgi:hypothetical protein
MRGRYGSPSYGCTLGLSKPLCASCQAMIEDKSIRGPAPQSVMALSL